MQLKPIKEAAKLLQLRKASKNDVDSILDLCGHLSSLQVSGCFLPFSTGPDSYFREFHPSLVTLGSSVFLSFMYVHIILCVCL